MKDCKELVRVIMQVGGTGWRILRYLKNHGPSNGHQMKPDVKNAAKAVPKLKKLGLVHGGVYEACPRPCEMLSITALGLEVLSLYE